MSNAKNNSNIKQELEDLNTILKLEKVIQHLTDKLSEVEMFCDKNIEEDICIKILNIIK